jgi:tetratricopeptide (TPR) repeat protein
MLYVALVLGSLCSPSSGFAASSLERGVALFESGDFVGAARELEAAHKTDPSDIDATLLLGITYYRLGQQEDAEPLLKVAQASDDPDVSGSARIFLGLLANDEGDAGRAEMLLERVAGSPSSDLAASARSLLQQTVPATWTVALALRPEYDSNVSLLPGSAQNPGPLGPQADGDLLALGSVQYRPFSAARLLLNATSSYREQLHLTKFNSLANSLSARYGVSFTKNDQAELAYEFELLTLGSSLYALGDAAEAGYRRKLFGDFGLGANYTLRYRKYYPADYSPYTGLSHTVAVGPRWGGSERSLELGASYLLAKEYTDDHSLTAFGQGGSIFVSAHPFKAFELTLTSFALDRRFPGTRRDVQLYGGLSATVDLTVHLALVVGGTFLRNISNDSGFDYKKATAYLGLAYGAAAN